ncbi:16830_t:CDS:2 [Acaulospora colombiana]|uniref:16830_t:CDS:1 n=1 Tax=Acaulospora colombiana TaxID=27376 RepID=A0ACA9LD54_9GLOM|nr:16830_t:CDS:2 [Acaulospora colombiana]
MLELKPTFVNAPLMRRLAKDLQFWFCTYATLRFSILKIRRIPALFLSSDKDTLVPKDQMKKLYDLLDTKGGKTWRSFPDGEHADTINQHGYFETIDEFLRWSVAKDEVMEEQLI